jgi:triacylglycerol lipase
MALGIPHLPVSWATGLRGAALETGWVTVRLAGMPLDLAQRSVEGCAALLGGRGTADGDEDGGREREGRDKALGKGGKDSRHALGPGARSGSRTQPGVPVVFVHGLADRSSVFGRLRGGLQECGAGPFFAAEYNAYLPDIRSAARSLGERVEQVRERTGGRPVCVIGHSLGGLIARYYVQRLHGDAHVPLAVTLATPHQGTAVAHWAPWHPLMRQLRPGSALFEELAEPCPGCRTRFVSFYSDLDEAVIPTSRGLLTHPDLRVRNVLVHGVGHLTLPVHGAVIEEVRAVLAERVRRIGRTR